MTQEQKPPGHMWRTPMGRAIVGFMAEIKTDPARFSDTYLSNLINQEIQTLRTFGRTFGWLLILNSVSLAYVQGVKLDFSVFGQRLLDLPAASQTLCLFLGLATFGFSIHGLDIMILARLRIAVVVSKVRTDLPNFATAYMKGRGLWVDLLTPRFIGYSSGHGHRAASAIFLVVSFVFFIAIFVASGASLIGLYKFGLAHSPVGFNWPTIVSSAGLAMGCMGIAIFFWAMFVPLKYRIRPNMSAPG
jgi:hypothetical protein